MPLARAYLKPDSVGSRRHDLDFAREATASVGRIKLLVKLVLDELGWVSPRLGGRLSAELGSGRRLGAVIQGAKPFKEVGGSPALKFKAYTWPWPTQTEKAL